MPSISRCPCIPHRTVHFLCPTLLSFECILLLLLCFGIGRESHCTPTPLFNPPTPFHLDYDRVTIMNRQNEV